MLKYFLVLFLSIIAFHNLKAQKIHATYTHITPLYSEVKEELFVEDSVVVGIRDSVFIKKNNKNSVDVRNGVVNITGKTNIHREFYYKSSSSNKIIIRHTLSEKDYWINDEIPKIEWNTDYDETLEIAGFQCKKATAEFRGSSVTAFYAPGIPISEGPFKFRGLPGLIFYVGEDNSDINIWKLDKIDLKSEMKIKLPSLPQQNINYISYKDFLDLRQSNDRKIVDKLTANLPKGTVVSNHSIARKGIEKKYEWE